MRTLKIREAAELLSVSPNTLRAWERRFGYPLPQRTAGKHRVYAHAEIAALRDALQSGLSISSAVSRAREAMSGDTNVLGGALASFDLARADAAMEAAVALRSLERGVEEVLLPALQATADRFGVDSAPWALTARWAETWLRWAHKLAPAPSRPSAIVVGDATADSLDPDALVVRAFELFCVRSGARVLSLPVRRCADVADVIDGFGAQAIVLAGSGVADIEVSRWAYQVRSAAEGTPMLRFRREASGGGAGATAALPDAPFAAHRRALAATEPEPAWRRAGSGARFGSERVRSLA